MKKIIFRLIIGLILLITGIVILKLAGHKHMSKGFIISIIGFILSGASGVTLYQLRKYLSRQKTISDKLD